MNEPLLIPVMYKGLEYCFEAQVVATEYVSQIVVLVNGVEVAFEPDEERQYRAIVKPDDQTQLKQMDFEMIGLICVTLQGLGDQSEI